MSTVLLTGATGLIGSELLRRTVRWDPDILPRCLSFDLILRHATRIVCPDRNFEIAALPPTERKQTARRHGIRRRV